MKQPGGSSVCILWSTEGCPKEGAFFISMLVAQLEVGFMEMGYFLTRYP